MSYPSVSLVVPMYDEESRIDALFEGIEEFASLWEGDYEVILVDDGSKDHTFKRVLTHPGFNILKLEHRLKLLQQANSGKGSALKTGIQAASKSYTLTLDADLAARPVEIIQWLRARKGFSVKEILIGSREHHNSKIRSSVLRHWVGNIFNLVTRWILGTELLDTQCGFKLYSTSAAKSLFHDLQIPGWSHDIEILMKANYLGYDIVEMPLKWDEMEGSKINVLRDGWNMFWEVIRIAAMKRNWKQSFK